MSRRTSEDEDERRRREDEEEDQRRQQRQRERFRWTDFNTWTTSGFLKRIISIAVIIILLVVFIPPLISLPKIVPSGYRGVQLTFGEATGKLDEGLHFLRPWVDTLELMNVQVQKSEGSESAASSDLQTVTINITVNYRLNTGYVVEIYKDFRQDYDDRFITPTIKDIIKAVSAQYKAEDLIAKREEVRTVFLNLLSEKLNKFHIDVVAVSITNFQFSAQFDAAIEAKVVQIQKAQEAENKLRQVYYEQQQNVVQAEAQANVTITLAQADAQQQLIAANASSQARILQAFGESEYLRLVTSNLSPEYLQYMQLNMVLSRWDGALPYFYSGSGSSPLLILFPQGNSTITIPTNSTAP